MSHLARRRPLTLLRCAAPVLLLPVLAACGTAGTAGTAQVQTVPATVAPARGPAPSSGGGAATVPAIAPGTYVDQAAYDANRARYSTGKVVLFFHAPWCPSCRETEKNLRADPAAIPAGLTVVKVDYDSSTELKQRYGVTQQHTFVSIAPDGAALHKWSGTFSAAEIAAKA